jgi:hypothetical protein
VARPVWACCEAFELLQTAIYSRFQITADTEYQHVSSCLGAAARPGPGKALLLRLHAGLLRTPRLPGGRRGGPGRRRARARGVTWVVRCVGVWRQGRERYLHGLPVDEYGPHVRLLPDISLIQE